MSFRWEDAFSIRQFFLRSYRSDKQILSFLKIDKGLEEEQNGVQLKKHIPNLSDLLKKAHDLGIFGTKMRSVIHSYNETGIKKIVKQQFDLAKIIYNNGSFNR